MRNNTPRSNTKQPTKEELENALLRSSGTQGRAKLEQYFLEIVRTQEFQDAVRELRSCYDIPEIGFNTEERIYPPAAWKHRRAGAKIQMIGQEIDKLSEEYGLTPMYWGNVIEGLVFYNDTSLTADFGGDLCVLADLQEQANEPFSKKDQTTNNENFPIAIRISPFASQRDIIDFVKKNELFISNQQARYKRNMKDLKIGKVRRKDGHKQKRNDFIYEHKHLPRKEIAGLLGKKFGMNGVLDYAHISKIISSERQKREGA